MTSLSACRICSGQLELFYRGASQSLSPDRFSPTNHRPGEHGDLYRCRECRTVHQPSLPDAGEIHDLYRDMSDAGYLGEEDGRRATALRLIGYIAKYVPAGRLLDVGCGHGLLLDEARRQGYDVTGIELSRTAARYAREALDLDVREVALEELEPEGGGFNAIVLADVIEHLSDPAAALDRCAELLAPGGALCVVTPDPDSLTARLAGRRWWGYIPAHTCLIPRYTLRELLSARGLVVSDDLPLVRTFSADYWVRGLVERSAALARLSGALGRTRAAKRPLSLSLYDERIIVAHKTEVAAAAAPLVRDRGGQRKVHVVLPAYNAEKTVAQVAQNLPVEAADRALLCDDASTDDTARVALSQGFDVIRHPANRGYGANQKTCYVRALRDGADVVVMVHADNQYDPTLLAKMVRPIEDGQADVVIGSRLLEDEAIAGGMPRWKWVGNRFLTWIENRAFRTGFSEFHTGYRAFSADLLDAVAFLRNSDGFVFDQEIFAQVVARDARVEELAIPTRYFLEASSVSFMRSVEYGLHTLYVLLRFRLDERGRRWRLLRRPAAAIGPARAGGDRFARPDADAALRAMPEA